MRYLLGIDPCTAQTMAVIPDDFGALVEQNPMHLPARFPQAGWVEQDRSETLVVDREPEAGRIPRLCHHTGFGRKDLWRMFTGPDGKTTALDCDTLVFSGNWILENEMVRRASLQLDPLTRGPEVDAGLQSSTPGIFVAGNLLRGLSREAEPADACALEGTSAGKSIANYLENQKGEIGVLQSQSPTHQTH